MAAEGAAVLPTGLSGGRGARLQALPRALTWLWASNIRLQGSQARGSPLQAAAAGQCRA